MFIKITDKESLISELRKQGDNVIVVHYNCTECDDEQVTYSFEGNELGNLFEANDDVAIHYNCTNCSHTEIWLKVDYIQGIEII